MRRKRHHPLRPLRPTDRRAPLRGWVVLILATSGGVACPRSSPPPPEPLHPPSAARTAPSAVDWCAGHSLPESKCTKCNPELIPRFKAAGDWCHEHGFPESACPLCNPAEPPQGAEETALEARIVRLRSPELEEATGIETVVAEQTKASTTLECPARIAFHADRVAEVRAIVPGIIRRVYASLGQSVEAGTPLFELESTQVGEMQGTLRSARERIRTARANLARQRELRADDIASARQVELAAQELAVAQAEAQSAATTLRMAGAATTLQRPASTSSGRSTLSAPLAGTVVRRPAVVGLLATETESLATIADTSVMWALCAVSEADASRTALGQAVFITVRGEAQIKGELTWISAEVDPRTRTVTTRAEVPNPAGHLRAHQFARAHIQVDATRFAVSVPRSSVHRVGTREVVFVRTEPGLYEPRVVRRHGDGAVVQIEGRVRPGDPVVTTGGVLLRTEIMPGSIGAGCCEVELPGEQ